MRQIPAMSLATSCVRCVRLETVLKTGIKWVSFLWQPDQERIKKLSLRTIGLEPQRDLWQSPFWEVWGRRSPSWILLLIWVNFACIFAHIRYVYAEKSVCLLHLQSCLQTLVGLHHPHPLPCICPTRVRLDYTLSVTVLCVLLLQYLLCCR